MDYIFPIYLMETDYSVINNKRLNRQLKCAARCHATLMQLDSSWSEVLPTNPGAYVAARRKDLKGIYE